MQYGRSVSFLVMGAALFAGCHFDFDGSERPAPRPAPSIVHSAPVVTVVSGDDRYELGIYSTNIPAAGVFVHAQSGTTWRYSASSHAWQSIASVSMVDVALLRVNSLSATEGSITLQLLREFVWSGSDYREINLTLRQVGEQWVASVNNQLVDEVAVIAGTSEDGEENGIERLEFTLHGAAVTTITTESLPISR